MAVTMGWRAPFEGEDLHVLRGRPSVALDQLVTILSDGMEHSPAGAVAAGLISSIDFRPRLRIGGVITTTYTAPGIEVVALTGQVLAAQVPPGQGIGAFYMDVTALRTTAGDPPLETSLLVRVHDQVTQAWLTPSPLTLPRDVLAPGGGGGAAAPIEPRSWRRPTVLAEFDDGVIGDVTNHPGIVWMAMPGVSSDPARGFVARSTTAPGESVQLLCMLPVQLGAMPAGGQGVVAAGWEERPAAELTVECVTGVGTAADADAAAANVLILCDGVPDAADQLNLARALGRRTAAMPPFSWVGPAIRFWTVPVVSREPGGTWRAPVYARTGDTHGASDLRFPVPVKPPETPTTWLYDRVLHEMGPAGPAPSGGWPELPDQIDRWELLQPYTAEELTARIAEGPYEVWTRTTATSIALNERDSPFSVRRDDRRGGKPKPSMEFDPNRFSRGELDRLLGALIDSAGTPIGDRWTTGDDRRLVVVMCGGQARSGHYSPADEMVLMSLDGGGKDDFLRELPGVPGVEYAAPWWPTGPPAFAAGHELRALFAHELAHALGLGDEYGTEAQLPHPVWAQDAANLQAEAGDDGLAGPGGLDGERIRWNHHRIARAFLLERNATIEEVPPNSVDPPHEVDGALAFIVRLQPGQLQRAADDGFDLADGLHPVLVLRSRPTPRKPLDDWIVSPPVSFLGRDLATDRVHVREFVSGSLAPFLADLDARRAEMGDPILVATVVKLSEPGGQALLVPKMIRDHVTSTRRPLDAPPVSTAATWACVDDGLSQDSTEWPALTNRPAGLGKGRPFFPSRRVPGVWTGGHTFDCGVFHPTAHSIMRGSIAYAPPAGVPPEELVTPPGGEPLPEIGHVNAFCPVARYLLIDRLDPTQHHRLEAQLSSWDPD